MLTNTSEFLTDVRLRGNIPDTSNDNNINSDANILKIATSLFLSKFYPRIQATRGDFYVASPSDNAITANQSEYDIPARAAGAIVRDVQMIQGNQIFSLPFVDPDHISTTATGSPEGYYLRHDKVVLYPTPSATSGTLRIRYYQRPSRLEQTSNCAQISSINTSTNQVVVSSIPSSWTTATELDFVKKTSPYTSIAVDQNATNISSTTLTFSSLPSGLAVGDWLAPAEYTPIPQMPSELIPVLAQMTVVKVLEAMGDRDGNNVAWKDLQDDLEQAMTLITPRNHGEPQKLVGRNFGRGSRFYR